MQHSFACKVAIDEELRDRADLAPARLDRNLRLEPARGETDAAALDAYRFVEQHETGVLVRQG
jgi:hypothetical protein